MVGDGSSGVGSGVPSWLGSAFRLDTILSRQMLFLWMISSAPTYPSSSLKVLLDLPCTSTTPVSWQHCSVVSRAGGEGQQLRIGQGRMAGEGRMIGQEGRAGGRDKS